MAFLRLSALVLLIAMQIVLVALGVQGIMGGVLELPHLFPFNQIPEALVPASDGWGPWFYWLAVLLLPTLYWMISLFIRQRDQAIAIKTSSSEVIRIYKTAITQFIANIMDEIAEVIDHTSTVRQVGKGIDLRLKIKVKPIPNVPRVQSEIERVVRRRVTELLGIERIHKITVDVSGFGTMERTAAAAEPLAGVAAAGTTDEDFGLRPEAEKATQPIPSSTRVKEYPGPGGSVTRAFELDTTLEHLVDSGVEPGGSDFAESDSEDEPGPIRMVDGASDTAENNPEDNPENDPEAHPWTHRPE